MCVEAGGSLRYHTQTIQGIAGGYLQISRSRRKQAEGQFPLAGGGSTSIGPAPFSGERARTASREAASTHAHAPNVTCRANQLRDFCVTGPCVCVESQQNKRREKSGFDNCFKAVWIVQSGREKISLSENRKSCTSSRRPDST